MRRARVFQRLVLVLMILGLGMQTVAQDQPIRDYDNYGNIRWADEMMVLNRFAKNLLADKSMIGYFVVYAGLQSCPGEAKYRGERAKRYLIKQGVERKRLVVLDAGYKEEVTWFWVMLPKDAAPYEPIPSLYKKSILVRKRCVDKGFARRARS
jgi:hypothetical protein